MKAITIWRPWALFICTGEKRIENRSWAPPPGVLGERVAIHAGQRMQATAFPMVRRITGVDVEATLEHHEVGIIGTVRIAGWWRIDRGEVVVHGWEPGSAREDLTSRDRQWFVGPYGWALRDPILFKHAIPVSWSAEILERPGRGLPEDLEGRGVTVDQIHPRTRAKSACVCGVVVAHVQIASYAASGFKTYHFVPVGHRRHDGARCTHLAELRDQAWKTKR